MSYPQVIGICGLAGSGKSEIGKILKRRYGYESSSFASPLREMVAQMIETKEFHAKLPTWAKLYLASCDVEEVWSKPTTDAMRQILQYVGTEIYRAEDPDFWTKAWTEALEPGKRYVVDDVRFHNEVAAVKAAGGSVWRVTRKSARPVGIKGHASESFCDSLPACLVIPNDSTLFALEVFVEASMTLSELPTV